MPAHSKIRQLNIHHDHFRLNMMFLLFLRLLLRGEAGGLPRQRMTELLAMDLPRFWLLWIRGTSAPGVHCSQESAFPRL